MNLSDYSPASDVLKERVILVTGAGLGIGRSVSLALAAHGATVILLDKTLANIENVYDEIETQGGPLPALYPMNLESASEHDYEQLTKTLSNEFGALHGLINNAAELPYLSRIDDYDMNDWLRVMQVNVNAAFLLSRACLPLLKAADSASVLFTSDEAGRTGKAYWGAYGVSKFAVEGLMQVLHQETEGSTAIRVNSIDPGPVDTSMRRRVFQAEDYGLPPSSTSLTNAYVYLMSDDSADVNGQALTL